MSHPEWVRGLKLSRYFRKYCGYGVAPRVGAWIETSDGASGYELLSVAPRVGAWIETLSLLSCVSLYRSHPEWVRGLKLLH